MDCDKIKQSGCAETKRFFLGDSDSDSEWDEPKARRFSMSGSECSDDDIIGGTLTNLNFVVDDDSGLGMSVNNERESINSNDSSQILPLRPVNIGKSAASKNEHKHYRTRRAKKYRFNDFYEMKNDHLGSGAYASVSTCVSRATRAEFAVKLVSKHEPGHTRSRILREVEIFEMCRDHPNIVQLIEWFEDDDYFYMIFEKMQGGPLLSQIQKKVCFNEQEAAQVIKDIANALKFLHSKGSAHRDLKPENVLCVSPHSVSPVKLCDLDLASKPSVPSVRRTSRQLHNVQSEPDLSSPVGSAEFLAPEVVETFVGESMKYNRQCDMWSLGVIAYIMLCGYVPFYGECDKADSCGWNEGRPCDDCQENLFEKIRKGAFEFPPEEWDSISVEAKDLISHLLVKDIHQRYTANDVLRHPWISSAPETPLNTANLLFRNNSTKDIQQYNDHFNVMNHFATRLSSRLEETIPSIGSTPENEFDLHDALQLNLTNSHNVVTEASKKLEQQCRDDAKPKNNYYAQLSADLTYFPQHSDETAGQMPMYYPPLINMNGVMIYAPTMAPNAHMMQQHLPRCYSQHPSVNLQQPFYTGRDYEAGYENYRQQQNYMPTQMYQSNEIKLESPPVNNKLKSYNVVLGQVVRVNSAAGLQRPLTPVNGNLDSIDVKKLQRHRASLSTAISQLGLETCQNAMVRQGSTGREIHAHQTRETKVNV